MKQLQHISLLLVLLLGCACAAPEADDPADKTAAAPQDAPSEGDLKTDASTYIRRYSDWGGGYPGNNYNNYATGYGLLDDKYSTYNGGYNGYNGGYSGYAGYNGYTGNAGYNGYTGNAGYGYTGNKGYGYNGYAGYDGGYGQGALGSNGGYGGYGGNGGLTSYYGYNNPYYQGSYHLGYGYRKPGNIYSSAITPSLVTGYRGYSRR